MLNKLKLKMDYWLKLIKKKIKPKIENKKKN
jgi:hypothetical protein